MLSILALDDLGRSVEQHTASFLVAVVSFFLMLCVLFARLVGFWIRDELTKESRTSRTIRLKRDCLLIVFGSSAHVEVVLPQAMVGSAHIEVENWGSCPIKIHTVHVDGKLSSLVNGLAELVLKTRHTAIVEVDGKDYIVKVVAHRDDARTQGPARGE